MKISELVTDPWFFLTKYIVHILKKWFYLLVCNDQIIWFSKKNKQLHNEGNFVFNEQTNIIVMDNGIIVVKYGIAPVKIEIEKTNSINV